MNVYNEAHNLAQAVKESEEFKNYDSLRKKIDANQQLSEMVNDIQKKQLDLQMKQMSGQVEGDIQAQLTEIYQLMMRDPLLAEFFTAEARFSLMMQDVYKILNEAVGLQFGFTGEEEKQA